MVVIGNIELSTPAQKGEDGEFVAEGAGEVERRLTEGVLVIDVKREISTSPAEERHKFHTTEDGGPVPTLSHGMKRGTAVEHVVLKHSQQNCVGILV